MNLSSTFNTLKVQRKTIRLRRLLALFFFCFALQTLNAQIDVNFGPSYQRPNRASSPDVLGSNANNTYLLRFQTAFLGQPEAILECYSNANQKLDYAKPISTHSSTGDYELEALYLLKERIVVFASRFDREKDRQVIFGKTLGLDGHVVNDWRELTSVSTEKRSNLGTVLFREGRDSASVVLIVSPPYEKYADEKFTLMAFDQELNKTWSRAIALPYKDKFFELKQYIFTASGDVYLLATVTKDRDTLSREARHNAPLTYHSVLLYDQSADSLKEFLIQLDPKFISQITIEAAPNGNIICAGFYSNKSSEAVIGTFYLNIDKTTKQVISKGTMDFDANFLTQFMSARKVAKKGELLNYELRHLILREDGGAILVAEQYYDEIICSTDPRGGQVRCTDYYYYNDIIVISIAPTGTISWAQKIAKRQMSANDGGYFSSFAFAVVGDNMYFLFNDNPRNLKNETEKKKKETRYVGNPRKAVTVLVVMNSRGEQTKQFLFRNKDLKLIPRPKLQAILSANDFLLYGELGKMYRLGRLTIKN